MDIIKALDEFKKEIGRRGHSQQIVWIQASQIWLSKKKLYVFIPSGFPYEFHIERAYKNCEGDLECGATLMLVCEKEGISYCTLLMDSFGSDTDVEFEADNFYLWCTAYVENFEPVYSSWRWFWLTKIRKNYQLSSLDYAFSLRQAIT